MSSIDSFPFQGLLSDGTLAWRFYIIFGRKKWALYLPATMVAINARELPVSLTAKALLITCLHLVFCWSADFQHLAWYHHPEEYENTLVPVTIYIAVAWGFSMFFANSVMTGGILYKIM